MGQQREFAREQVHLNLAALTTAVIDDTVEADRRGFGGTAGSMSVSSLRIVAEFNMPDFMRDEKGLVEDGTESAAATSVRRWWRAGGRHWGRISAFTLSSS